MRGPERITPAARDAGSTRSGRSRIPAALGTLALVGIVVACSATSTPTLPSSLPSSVPSVLGALPTSSGGTACLDATTMGIFAQLQAQGADATSILSQNKQAMTAALQAFQAPDQTTATWRDQVVSALQAGDFATAAARIEAIGSSGITLHTC